MGTYKKRKKPCRKCAVGAMGIAFTPRSLVFMILGGIASRLSNGVINTLIEKLPDAIKTQLMSEYAQGGIQAAKTFLMHWLYENGYLGGDMVFGGIGFALDSGTAAVGKVMTAAAPDLAQKLALSGTGDLFINGIGNTELMQIPINPSGELAGGIGDEVAVHGDMYEDEVTVHGGNGDLYSDELL